jgi:membrane-bound lytic murein transglycosylase B
VTPLPNFRHFSAAAIVLVAGCALSTVAFAGKPHKSKRRAGSAQSQPPLAGPLYAQREDAMRFATDIAARENLSAEWVRQTLGQARYLPLAAKYVQPAPSGSRKNWTVYRSRFIDATRIEAGVRFWKDNQEALARAERETGVPAEVIVGIVGVESIYGQQVGNFRVIDALATLAFDFPATHPRAGARSEFFKSELSQLFGLTSRSTIDPMSLRGSFAGAMGMPQFMPSSWLKYAVDFDGDGRIDLFKSAADVIGSVAYYFKAFNWQPGMPTHYPVSFNAQTVDMKTMLAPDILPTFSVEQFIAQGAVLSGEALSHQGPLALVELQDGDRESIYIAGTENFYAITRYNWSSYYALAVIELGREVAKSLRN